MWLLTIDFTDAVYFPFWTWNQNDPVCLEALSLAGAQQFIGFSIPINELTPQAVSCWAAQSGKRFDRLLTAVFSSC